MFNATIKTKILGKRISTCIIKSCHCNDRDTKPTASTASSLQSSGLSFMLIVQIVNALFDVWENRMLLRAQNTCTATETAGCDNEDT